jgi:hypothetical protein
VYFLVAVIESDRRRDRPGEAACALRVERGGVGRVRLDGNAPVAVVRDARFPAAAELEPQALRQRGVHGVGFVDARLARADDEPVDRQVAIAFPTTAAFAPLARRRILERPVLNQLGVEPAVVAMVDLLGHQPEELRRNRVGGVVDVHGDRGRNVRASHRRCEACGGDQYHRETKRCI